MTTEGIDIKIMTYNTDTFDTKYCREFWQMGKMKCNIETDYPNILEIQKILDNKSISSSPNFINDKLANLVNIQLSEEALNLDITTQSFEDLKFIRIHGYAYNTLTERYSYYYINRNSSEFIKD